MLYGICNRYRSRSCVIGIALTAMLAKAVLTPRLLSLVWSVEHTYGYARQREYTEVVV